MTATNTDSNSTNKPSAIWRTLINLQNPFMKWLLRAPFHIFVSKMYMLITFTGRKSGTVYTTPVQYARQNNDIYVLTSEGYTWWKNLRGGTEVELLIRRHGYRGYATTSTDPQDIRNIVRKIYPKLSDARTETFIQGKVAIQITLKDVQS